jgi:hypothetical protein
VAIEPTEKKEGILPAPLKKRQERFVPNGNIENLRIMHPFLQERNEQEGTPASLGLEAAVVGGEYDGTPITDYLNIQESTKNPGELYISKKGKLLKTLENALTTKEWNAHRRYAPVKANQLRGGSSPLTDGIVLSNK